MRSIAQGCERHATYYPPPPPPPLHPPIRKESLLNIIYKWRNRKWGVVAALNFRWILHKGSKLSMFIKFYWYRLNLSIVLVNMISHVRFLINIIHCEPYDVGDIGQHWFNYRHVAWQQHSNTWTSNGIWSIDTQKHISITCWFKLRWCFQEYLKMSSTKCRPINPDRNISLLQIICLAMTTSLELH